MERFKSVNVYDKNGKVFVVCETNDGKVYTINYGLLKYAIEHIKKVKEKSK